MPPETSKPVIVIGAGPAGMTAAYCLARAGVPVVVYEGAERVGGLARSLDLWGQRIDLGPHRFFSSDPWVNGLWLEVVGRDYRMVDRLTRIFYGGKFFDYPLKATNALLNLGPFEALRCVLSYLREKFRKNPEQPGTGSFESWVVSRFGRRLFEIFFKSYSEKLWGISCQELDSDFASQRIKKFSLGQAIKSVFVGGGKHKTLVDRFAYPVGGTGAVYEKMADKVAEMGGKVKLGSPVRGVWTEGKVVKGIVDGDGIQIEASHVISTMPLTLMVKSLGSLPLPVEEAVTSLRFRNTILVFLEVEGTGWFPDQWLYIHSVELQTGRLTNFRNWIPEICQGSPHTILALEYWCYDEDALWKEDEGTLVNRATEEIYKTGLIPAGKVLQGKAMRLPRCYPVYSRGYHGRLRVVQDFLQGFTGLSAIGRYGAFKYNNQDHSILMGLMVAENLTKGTKHDLWAVNTDYEVYQEAAIITESGLAPA